MRTALLSLFLALALTSATFGRPDPQPAPLPPGPPTAPSPTIVGLLKYKPNQLVRLRADNVPPKAGLVWRVTPSAGVDRATTPRGVLEFAAPPGSYEVELLVITQDPEGSVGVAEAKAAVNVGDAPPAAPKPRAGPEGATGKIRFGNAGCTATVVGPRRPDGRWDILTASHCTGGVGSRGTYTAKDGSVYHVAVTARNTTPDISWLVTDEAPEDMPHATLAASVPAAGVAVWHVGLGVDRPGNREEGVVLGEIAGGQIAITLSVSSGDSGSGIFRADTGELVGVVCCTQKVETKTTMYAGTSAAAGKLRPAPGP